MKIVTPHQLKSNGLFNIFTGKKKWTIRCGECYFTFEAKLPLMEISSGICPYCNTLNQWYTSDFFDHYRKIKQQREEENNENF